MRALFLVALFSFLRKPNLVVPSACVISPKVPRRSDFHVSPHGAFLNIRAAKTIQFFRGHYAFLFRVRLSVLLRLLHITFALTHLAHQTLFFQLGPVRLRPCVLLLLAIFPVF